MRQAEPGSENKGTKHTQVSGVRLSRKQTAMCYGDYQTSHPEVFVFNPGPNQLLVVLQRPSCGPFGADKAFGFLFSVL